MTDKVKEEEISKEAEDAAFLAEMAEPLMEADVIAPEEVEAKAEPEESEEGSDEHEPDPEPVERIEVIAGYTEEEITERFARLDKMQASIDKTNGTLGSKLANQQQVLDELKANGGQKLVGTLDPRVLAKLEEEYPELAELLKPDSDADGVIQGTSIDQSAIENRLTAFEQKQIEKEQARELRALTKQHGDWKDIAMFSANDAGDVEWKDPRFGEYVATLPEDTQQTLLNVWDADLVADTITDFKATLKAKPTPPKKPKPSLEDAVRPEGLQGKQTLSEADEEEAAFRAEMANI